MTAARKPSAPKELGARGRTYWRTVVATYELNMDELQLLAETCRTLDDIDALHELVTTDGRMVPGSMGQRRIHPAVAELRQARTLLARLVAQLGLPHPDEKPVSETPEQRRARKAAEARWSRKRAEQERRKATSRGQMA